MTSILCYTSPMCRVLITVVFHTFTTNPTHSIAGKCIATVGHEFPLCLFFGSATVICSFTRITTTDACFKSVRK